MIYKEEYKDLFSVNFKEYTPVHCISADCKMGAGIAVPMKKKFKLNNMKSQLDEMILQPGHAVYYHGVYNLITKKKYYAKPTYDTMAASLTSMYYHITQHDIKKIVMPKIGSGLDKLSWPKVRELIQDIFEDTDIEILVCVR